MKKKIVVSGPSLSASGYGRMCRFALQSLRRHEDKFDIYALVTNWGNTGNIFHDSEEISYINNLAVKTQTLIKQTNNNPQFDISIQVTIPNEWKKIANINIGYTAGIETNFISPAWLQPSQQMDKIIVISEHAKSGFMNTVFGDNNGNQFKVATPVEVCHFPVKSYNKTDIDVDLPNNFNFLSVCQWGPRKNLEQTIINFIEEFKNEKVGLVLKVNVTNDSIMDKELCETKLNEILQSINVERKCSVHLIHGHMKDEEMNSLYSHPKIKAIVSSTHGEGFGFPLFEAVYNELPVIATDWSGHLDFLTMNDEEGVDKKMFAKVDYLLNPIAKEHVWKGVLEEGSSWAYPVGNSLKSRMREVYKDYNRFKSWAKKLNNYVRETFTEEKVYDKFISCLDLFFKKQVIAPKKINGISFCIPTHGKRYEKTLKTIRSIQKQNWNNLSYEIIIAGDIDSFTDLQNIKLVDLKEDSHNRKAAKLRNAAADISSYDNIVFCDDDMILSDTWLDQTISYSENNGWNVLGNKILNPDGTRHWDKTILVPRRLVDYNHPEIDKNLMVTSNFFLIRKDIYLINKWDESKLSYADRLGDGMPEDVHFHLDLRNKNNIMVSFNQNSVVWHNDENYSYIRLGDLEQTLNKQTILKLVPGFEFPEIHPAFNKLLKD